MSKFAVSERTREGALYTVVLLAALVWRLPSMGEGFWIDEVMSAETIRDPFAMMLTRIGFTDVHPPGYYALLELWAGVLGDGDLRLRALSLVAGLGTVALLVRWIRHRAGRLAALFGGCTLALSPFHAHYSVEVRAYAAFTLVALALAWSVRRWVTAPTGRGLLVIGLLEVAALSLHYYALLWIALINLFVFTHRALGRPLRLRWLRAQVGALAVFAAWLPLLFVQLFELPEVMRAHLSDDLPLTRVLASLGPLPSLDPTPLAIATGGLILGLACRGAWTLREPAQEQEPPRPDAKAGSSLPSTLGLLTALLFMPLAPLALMPMSDALVEAYLRQLPWAYAALTGAVVLGGVMVLAERPRVHLSLPTWLAVGGPALVLVLTQVQPMLFLRNLLVFLPLVLLLAAFALDRVPRALQIVACLGIVGLSAPHFGAGSESFMPRQDFASAASALDSAPDGPVIVAPAWDALGLRRYLRGRPIVEAMDARAIAEAAGGASSIVVLLSRPSRLDVKEADVEGALGSAWRLEETRLLRGHRGPMQWLRYARVDG